MATPPRGQSRHGGASQNSEGQIPERLPFRPVGSPLRYPAASSHEAAPPAATMRWQWEHLVRAAFINRNFSLLWWGQAISGVGDYAWDTALVLWVASYLAAGQSWAPLAVSGVILAAALPQIVVGPIAGVFVDRWDKRRTIIIMAALQVIIATLLVLSALNISFPYLGSAQSESLWRIVAVYIDVILLSSCAQFFIPAQFALIKDIVPEKQQDKALETSQAIQGLAVIIGPPVAAALVFGLGVAWALVLNVASFVVVLLAILAIKSPPSAHSLAPGEAGHFSREFLDGLGYVIHHRVLRTILIAEVLTWLGFGALQSLGYFFITGNLHAPASDYGLLGADFGVGAIAGALLVRFLGQRIGLARLLWIALVTSGLFVIVMSHLTSLYPALVAAFLFGVSTTAIIVTAGPLALHGTSREFVGRVMAVINPLGRLAALVSVVLAGYLVSAVLRGFHANVLGISFDPVDTVFTGMGLLAVAGGIYARISLREIAQTMPSSPEPSSGRSKRKVPPKIGGR
jgi:MFS family permease